MERCCAYLYVRNAISLAKFIVIADLQMSYWNGDDLNRKEDGNEYAQKCKDRCEMPKISRTAIRPRRRVL